MIEFQLTEEGRSITAKVDSDSFVLSITEPDLERRFGKDDSLTDIANKLQSLAHSLRDTAASQS